MPELPEVETIKRGLRKSIISERIVDVCVHDSMVIRWPPPEEFEKRLIDKKVKDIRRRGKAILFEFHGGGFLVVQLVMTGQLIYGQRLKESKVIFKLSNHRYLNYNDQRRFGRLNFVSNLNQLKFLKTLGPEPLSKEFHFHWFENQLRNRKTPIKSLLMNQTFIAGLGNIYANEILFRSRIHPARAADTLKRQEAKVLYRNIIEVLREAIRMRGSSVNTYRDLNGRKGSFISRLKVYGRECEECYLCKTPIERIVQSGRSTFFCKRCQS
jgi:formamidopyrimidine-DNA glycosylase